jgi:hypothetical protein
VTPSEPALKCGDEIMVKDQFGTYVYRFIAQCGGRFITINSGGFLNGYLLPDWHGVLRELIAKTVPAKLVERRHDAQSSAGGQYHHVPLTYPLSAKEMADLLGVPVAEMRDQLADLAVETDG